MSQIILASFIAFLATAGLVASSMSALNPLGIVNAQNPEMMSDNSTMMSGNTTGNDTSMMSGNTTGNDTSMMSGSISGKGGHG